MQQEKQSALILTQDNPLVDKIKTILKNADKNVTLVNNLEELQTNLISEKIDLIVLAIDKKNEHEIGDFFRKIQSEREGLLILAYGAELECKPFGIDFYFNIEELQKTEFIESIIEGILGISNKFRNQSDLSAMLIHDMRSPMQSTLSYLELLLTGVFGQLNEGQIKLVKNTVRLQDQILNMMEDLGDVMRFESRIMSFEKQKFGIKEMIQEVIQGIWVQADKKNIKFSISISDEDHILNGDKTALNRVFTNIISNAIRFSPENGVVRVSCQTMTMAEGQHSCQIKITDSGEGIKEEDRELIFEKFFRIDRLKSAKGFGLGLYVARLFVEAHNGSIGVYNNREGGATFYVQLPTIS